MAAEMKKKEVYRVDVGDRDKYRMKEWKENRYGLEGRCTIERRTKEPKSKE